MFAAFWPVCGPPEGLASVLSDSELREKPHGLALRPWKAVAGTMACGAVEGMQAYRRHLGCDLACNSTFVFYRI